MMWLLMWLNVSIVTLNATLQLLVLYRFLCSCLHQNQSQFGHMKMTITDCILGYLYVFEKEILVCKNSMFLTNLDLSYCYISFLCP